MAEKIYDELLYEKLERAYQTLGLDENADEKTIKKKYRILVKTYHPDENLRDKNAEQKFKEIVHAYEILSDEKNRKVYQKLKEKYGSNSKAESESFWEQEKASEYTYKEPEEKNNRYIFKKRDGSTIEILPVRKVKVENQTLYEYKIIQYYKDKTIINNLYGRINLNELFRDKDYCDFCINVFLSNENLERTIVQYNGFLGYIEVARKEDKVFYRIVDRDKVDIFDISMALGNEIPKSNLLYLDDIMLEKFGTLVLNGRILNQYVYYSDYLNKISLIYSEEIDFEKYKKDYKYARVIESLLLEERVEEKVKQGGYIGSVAYNVETDTYDIVMDREIEKTLNMKQTKGR